MNDLECIMFAPLYNNNGERNQSITKTPSHHSEVTPP